jgi:hypothetical protein
VQTTTTRPSWARKQPAAPFSNAAAKLIEQIQAEARAQLLVDLSAKDAITVLHGFDAETRRMHCGHTRIDISDGKGNVLDLYRHHKEPNAWCGNEYMVSYWQPSRWYGFMTLVDANGAQWQRTLTPMVCNDFGDLVEVAA